MRRLFPSYAIRCYHLFIVSEAIFLPLYFSRKLLANKSTNMSTKLNTTCKQVEMPCEYREEIGEFMKVVDDGKAETLEKTGELILKEKLQLSETQLQAANLEILNLRKELQTAMNDTTKIQTQMEQ